MNGLQKIFNKDKNILIGAIHFPPMPGYSDYPGFEVALKNATYDLLMLEEGGMNAIIIENNYDIPHKEKISDEVKDTMIKLGKALKNKSKLSFGVSVLWNDYSSAFEIAEAIGASFIRIPVFVDDVRTDYGIMKAQADKVALFRKEYAMKDIQVYADIHVKHSEILSKLSVEESAKLAIEKGADALIVTGKWTGDAPQLEELIRVRNIVKDFPILCGSGVDISNIQELFKYANGAIVSTSVKNGIAGDHVNIKPYEARIDGEKVKKLTESIKLASFN